MGESTLLSYLFILACGMFLGHIITYERLRYRYLNKKYMEKNK